MTTILVTGATGTIGSTLVPLLQEQGANVRALVRDPDRAHQIAGEWGRDRPSATSAIPTPSMPRCSASTPSSWRVATCRIRWTTNAP